MAATNALAYATGGLVGKTEDSAFAEKTHFLCKNYGSYLLTNRKPLEMTQKSP